MNEIQNRLRECFSRVFPALTEDQIRTATPRTISEWDSIASISLVNVVEEEFNIQIDFEHVAELDSFDAIAAFLQEHASNA